MSPVFNGGLPAYTLMHVQFRQTLQLSETITVYSWWAPYFRTRQSKDTVFWGLLWKFSNNNFHNNYQCFWTPREETEPRNCKKNGRRNIRQSLLKTWVKVWAGGVVYHKTRHTTVCMYVISRNSEEGKYEQSLVGGLLEKQGPLPSHGSNYSNSVYGVSRWLLL